MKEYKYYVIGGQYEWYCYGGSDTLHGAKCLASKNVELWDNWGGLRTPMIYPAEYTEVVTDEYYGTPREIRRPIIDVTITIKHFRKVKGKWREELEV